LKVPNDVAELHQIMAIGQTQLVATHRGPADGHHLIYSATKLDSQSCKVHSLDFHSAAMK
jgi:hypothetical protein